MLLGKSAVPENNQSAKVKRIYRKRVRLFDLVSKIKLWPSRTGSLHGVRTIRIVGDRATLITHCNKEFIISDSVNSRAARWLRNKWFVRACPACRIPDWKLDKYGATLFRRHQGASLNRQDQEAPV